MFHGAAMAVFATHLPVIKNDKSCFKVIVYNVGYIYPTVKTLETDGP